MEEEVKEKAGFDFKKYLPYIGIAVAVIVVIVLLVSIFGGGPKKTVKKYLSGISKQNASKVIDTMDFAGMEAWKYSYDEKDFSEDDYDEFIENYKDVDKDDIKDAKKDAEEELEDMFEYIEDDYKSYKFKVEEFKSVEKIGKNLYVVNAKVSLTAKPKDKDDDEIDKSDTATFILYKNKIINSDI